MRGEGSKTTREYRVWDASEEEALRLGVKKHGLGAWEKIRCDPEFSSLLKRTGVQLKDKWRNLIKFRHISADESQQIQPKTSGPWSKKYAANATRNITQLRNTREAQSEPPARTRPSSSTRVRHAAADIKEEADQDFPLTSVTVTGQRKSQRNAAKRNYLEYDEGIDPELLQLLDEEKPQKPQKRPRSGVQDDEQPPRIRCPCGNPRDDGCELTRCTRCKCCAHSECLQLQLAQMPPQHRYSLSSWVCGACQVAAMTAQLPPGLPDLSDDDMMGVAPPALSTGAARGGKQLPRQSMMMERQNSKGSASALSATFHDSLHRLLPPLNMDLDARSPGPYSSDASNLEDEAVACGSGMVDDIDPVLQLILQGSLYIFKGKRKPRTRRPSGPEHRWGLRYLPVPSDPTPILDVGALSSRGMLKQRMAYGQGVSGALGMDRLQQLQDLQQDLAHPHLLRQHRQRTALGALGHDGASAAHDLLTRSPADPPLVRPTASRPGGAGGTASLMQPGDALFRQSFQQRGSPFGGPVVEMPRAPQATFKASSLFLDEPVNPRAYARAFGNSSEFARLPSRTGHAGRPSQPQHHHHHHQQHPHHHHHQHHQEFPQYPQQSAAKPTPFGMAEMQGVRGGGASGRLGGGSSGGSGGNGGGNRSIHGLARPSPFSNDPSNGGNGGGSSGGRAASGPARASPFGHTAVQSTRLPTKMSMFSVDEEIANAPLSALLSITAEEGDLLPIPKGAARGLSTMLVDTRDVADSRQRQDQGHGAATGAATTTTAGVPLPSGLPPRGGGAPTSASGMQRRASLSDRAPSLSKFRASSLDFDKDLDELVAEHALESMKLGRNDSLWLLNAQSDATHLDNLLRSNSIDPSLASLLQPQGGGGGGNGHHRGDGQHYVSPLMQALSLSHPSWSLNSSLALAASLGVPSQQQQQQQLQLQQQQQQVQQQQQTATAAQPAAGPPAGQSADAATATLPAGATLPAAATATQPSALISAQLAEEAVAPAAPPRPAGVLLSPFTAAAADDGESGGAFTGVQLEKAPALNATSGLSRLDTVDTLLSTAMALSEMQPSSSPEAILGATPPPDAMLGARLTADLVPGVPGVPVGPQPQGAAALASWNHTPTPPLRTDALVLPVAPPLSIPATTRHLMPEKGAYTGGPQPGPGAMGSTCKIAAARADSGALFNFDEM